MGGLDSYDILSHITELVDMPASDSISAIRELSISHSEISNTFLKEN